MRILVRRGASILMSACLVGGLVTSAGAGGFPEGEARSDCPEVYVIQPGDSLSGLADRFFGDSGKWRDLMAANPHIENPDAIFPGQTIAVCAPGAGAETVTPIEPVSPIVGEEFPVAAPIGADAATPDAGATGALVEADEAPAISITEAQYAYIVDRQVRAVALVEGARDDVEYYGQESLVYVGAGARDELLVGDRFTIFRDNRLVKHPSSGAILGYMFQLLGDCVLEQVDETTSICRIKTSYGRISPGDKLQPFSAVQNSVRKVENEREMSALIVGLPGQPEDLVERRSFFLDKGARDGVVEGNVANIYREGEITKTGTGRVVRLPRERVGSAIVFRVEEKTSTAWVFDSNRQMKRGDIATFE